MKMKNNALNTSLLHYIPFKHVVIFIFLFIIASCRKEPIAYEFPPNSFSGHKISARSPEPDQQIVDEAQWIIDNIIPLVSDESVYDDITSGNWYSTLATSKLLSLGYSGFDDFSQEFWNHTDAVSSAIRAGSLTAASIRQILLQNINNLNFSAMPGNSAYLPCYEEFVTNLMFVAVAVAAASETVVGAVIAGIAGTAAAYLQFKNCLHENYPNGG